MGVSRGGLLFEGFEGKRRRTEQQGNGGRGAPAGGQALLPMEEEAEAGWRTHAEGGDRNDGAAVAANDGEAERGCGNARPPRRSRLSAGEAA